MLVDNKPIRKAVEKANKEGLSYCEICRNMKWVTKYRCTTIKGKRPNKKVIPDTTRLKRSLGISRKSNHGRNEFARKMKYDSAILVIKAINYDPVDYGL